MIILGLTGSIGMGKSTTAAMFRQAGIPVHDADAVVHELYAGRAAPAIGQAFPGVVSGGIVDRKRLSESVFDNPEALEELETVVHPLVAEERDKFLSLHRAAGCPLVVLDIPLLFETGGERLVDKVAVVSADPEIQRKRVLDRPDMTEDKFAAILSRQAPDSEKRKRADFIIDTGSSVEAAHHAVAGIIAELSEDRSRQLRSRR